MGREGPKEHRNYSKVDEDALFKVGPTDPAVLLEKQ